MDKTSVKNNSWDQTATSIDWTLDKWKIRNGWDNPLTDILSYDIKTVEV